MGLFDTIARVASGPTSFLIGAGKDKAESLISNRGGGGGGRGMGYVFIEMPPEHGGGVRTVSTDALSQNDPAAFDLINKGGKITGGDVPSHLARFATSEAIEAAATGRPAYPTIDSMLKRGPEGRLSLAPNLTLGWKSGESPWEKMMLERQGLGESERKDALERGVGASRAAGFSALAGRGGISRSALERQNRSSLLDAAFQRQDLARQGMGERLGIGTDAEKMRLAASEFDINNILNQRRLEDAAKINKYSEQMKAFGAGKTADAYAKSGKK